MTASVLVLPHPRALATGAELRATVVSETVRACREAFADALRVVILTGSVARGEETWERQGDGATLLGDAEFLVLFRDGHRLPRPSAVRAVASTIEERLQRRRLRGEITLAPCHASYLARLRPSIFAYELRACGRAVWGDPAALRAVPSFTAGAIPREDAWRMLCNRLVEQVEPLADADSLAAPRPPAPVRYRAVKLHLDMATSLLVFLGAYAPSYRERAEKLERFASEGTPPSGLPLPLLDLARKVAACTRFKLEGEPAACLDGWPAWREAVRQARDLWRWETSVLTGLSASTPDALLWESCMEAQPLAARLRGWLYAARAEGWRAWRRAPRWARLARRASPRHCVYAAGTGLLFTLAGSGAAEAALERLAAWLPVARVNGAGVAAALASDVAANYHRFLVGTRA